MASPITPADLTNIVTLLAALSVSTERLVEIVKGWIPFLNTQSANPAAEGRRQALVHVLAVLCGIATAWLAQSALQGVLPENLLTPGGYVVIGLLASGGSGFWNSILNYVKAAKDTKVSLAAGGGQSDASPSIAVAVAGGGGN